VAQRALPEDWQYQVLEAVRKLEDECPLEELFGVSLPARWKPELDPFVRNGDLHRLVGVRAVSFSGEGISRLKDPHGRGAS